MDEVRAFPPVPPATDYITRYYFVDDPEFQQWVVPLISRLIPILLHPKSPRSLHENAAVSIGRIGLMHPALVAPHLPEFAQSWCQALYEIRDNEEKDSAFRGLCTLVQANPAGMAKVRSCSDAASFPPFPLMNGRLSFAFFSFFLRSRVYYGSATRLSGGTSHRRS